jgi:tetratricopeptide (TPR) repeat protein
LYGIENPRVAANASKPAEAAAGSGATEPPDFEVALVRPTERLAGIWMSFAGLYARTDRLREAEACCRLAGRIYEDLQMDFGAARALDLMRRVAGQLSDADAEEIIKAQEQELQRARDCGNRRLEITILKDLADCYIERSKYADAETVYKDLNTLSVRVRYRPIRLGFCVQKGELDELRRALQLTHAFWGGRFNPVIQVGTSEADRRLAKSLVEVFQVDALYPSSTAEPLKAFVKEFNGRASQDPITYLISTPSSCHCG